MRGYQIFAEPLDLNDLYCKMANDLGTPIFISSDAHDFGQLGQMKNGFRQARRGWLESENVLGTRNLPELKKLFKK
jgi:DNA polymerase (family X)